MNFNRLSNLIYKILNKRRVPRKEWLLSRKMKMKRNRNFYLDSNKETTYNMYLHNRINEERQVNSLNKRQYSILPLVNNTLFITRNEMYYILVLHTVLYSSYYNYSNKYYFYLFSFCKIVQNKNNYIIKSTSHSISTSTTKSNALNIFNTKNWLSRYIIQHDTNKYFHINNLFRYKVNVYNTLYIEINTKTVNNNFYFICKSSDLLQSVMKVYCSSSNNAITLNNINITNYYNYLKFTKLISNKSKLEDPLNILKKKTKLLSTYIVNKSILKKYLINVTNKSNITKQYKQKFQIIKNKNGIYNNKYNLLYKKKLHRHRKLLYNPNNIKDILASLNKSNERGRIIINTKYNNMLYAKLLYSKLKKTLKNKDKKNKYLINNMIINNRSNDIDIDIFTYYVNKNNAISVSNTQLLLYKYKLYTSYIKKLYYDNTTLCTNNIKILNDKQNYLYGLCPIYRNKYLYNVYFDNNIIYKEIFIEYIIRLNDINNNYDGKEVLNRRILFITDIDNNTNTGNIITGTNINTNIIKYSNIVKPYHTLTSKKISQLIMPIINTYSILQITA